MSYNKVSQKPTPKFGIHTILISIGGLLPEKISDRAEHCISKSYPDINPGTGELRTRFVINPNLWLGKDNWFHKYNEFEIALNEILDEIGVSDYKVIRVDFPFDYFDDNYDELHKIHKCICLLTAIAYSVENRYESTDPLSLLHLTTVIKNEYLEIENYYKKLESGGKSRVNNRLEIRSKSLNQAKSNFQGIPNLVDLWCARFNKVQKCYDELQDICNFHLIEKWRQEQGSKVKTISEFVRKYQDNIYTERQLVKLFSLLGKQNPEASVKYFRRNNKIDFISSNDLKSYIEILKNSMHFYVNNCVKIAPTEGNKKSA